MEPSNIRIENCGLPRVGHRLIPRGFRRWADLILIVALSMTIGACATKRDFSNVWCLGLLLLIQVDDLMCQVEV